MKYFLSLILLISVSGFAQQPGEVVSPVGNTIKNRMTGERIALSKSCKTMTVKDQPSVEVDCVYNLSVVSKNNNGDFVFVRELMGKMDVKEVNEFSKDAAEEVAETYGKYESNGKTIAYNFDKALNKLWSKDGLSKKGKTLGGKLVRNILAVVATPFYAIADGAKYTEVFYDLKVKDPLLNKKARKALARLNNSKFSGKTIRVSNKTFETIVAAF